MFRIFRKRHFLLTFVGFGPKGSAILQEATVCCREMSGTVIEGARKWARQEAKKSGVDVGCMCLVNSLELDENPWSRKGGTR